MIDENENWNKGYNQCASEVNERINKLLKI